MKDRDKANGRFIEQGLVLWSLTLFINPIVVNADSSSAETKAGLKMPNAPDPSFPNHRSK
jgi:hypothetical protein